MNSSNKKQNFQINLASQQLSRFIDDSLETAQSTKAGGVGGGGYLNNSISNYSLKTPHSQSIIN